MKTIDTVIGELEQELRGGILHETAEGTEWTLDANEVEWCLATLRELRARLNGQERDPAVGERPRGGN